MTTFIMGELCGDRCSFIAMFIIGGCVVVNAVSWAHHG